MATKSPIKYRDKASEELVVGLLSNEKERQAFLRDRHGYLSKFKLPVGPRNALMQLTDEQINRTAAEFNYNFPLASAQVDKNSPLALKKPRTGCEKSTFWDIFCDG